MLLSSVTSVVVRDLARLSLVIVESSYIPFDLLAQQLHEPTRHSHQISIARYVLYRDVQTGPCCIVVQVDMGGGFAPRGVHPGGPVKQFLLLILLLMQY